MRALCALCLTAAVMLPSGKALAHAQGVGLGVAAGVDVQHGKGIKGEVDEAATDQSFAWGFFVDIPLLETFFITPGAMIYELDLGGDKLAVTDIDLNFKFIVPLGRVRAGGGITAGISTGLGDYLGHYGLLGYLGFNLVANLDAFVLVQWKRLRFGNTDFDNLHGYLGGMFRF